MKRQIHLMIRFMVITAILIFAASQLRAYAAPGIPVRSEEALALTCQDIMAKALGALQKTCDAMGRNSACYGNNQIQFEAAPNTSPKFDTVGDLVAIREIKTLITSPLDVTKGTWGLSLLKLQATLPDTLPGQNVMFLVYGNTSIQNTSGDMQSFYFSTGLGAPDCKAAPRDGILVRSPNHTQVTFTANGVKITIASTVALTASANQNLTVRLVEGHASVSTADGTQSLQPGQSVSVPMGGATGLDPAGAPTAPIAAASDPTLQTVIVAANQVAPTDAKVNFALEGCVTAVNGNTVTIAGKTITLVTDGKSKPVKVGDCLHIEGNLIGGMLDTVAPTVVIDVPKPPTPQPKPTNVPQGNSGTNGNSGNGNGNNGGNSNAQGNDKDKNKDKDKDKNKGNGNDKKKITDKGNQGSSSTPAPTVDKDKNKDKNKDNGQGNGQGNGNNQGNGNQNGQGNGKKDKDKDKGKGKK